MRRTLLLCIGNEWRRDDGAGPETGRRIEALSLPGVRVHIALHLFPEHAELLAGVDVGVLVDASFDATTVRLRRAENDASAAAQDGSSFYSLLALSRALYGRSPEAWVCEIPGRVFSAGVGLSGEAARNVELAVAALIAFVSASAASPC